MRSLSEAEHTLIAVSAAAALEEEAANQDLTTPLFCRRMTRSLVMAPLALHFSFPQAVHPHQLELEGSALPISALSRYS
jgi:hypothetical protein